MSNAKAKARPEQLVVKADLRNCRVPVTFGPKLPLIGKRTMWITSWLTKQCNVLQAAAPAALIGSQ
jgi:hypothetical protein